jgi:hypothetical protein
LVYDNDNKQHKLDATTLVVDMLAATKLPTKPIKIMYNLLLSFSALSTLLLADPLVFNKLLMNNSPLMPLLTLQLATLTITLSVALNHTVTVQFFSLKL